MIDWFWSVAVPAAILLFATVSTFLLYRHFSRPVDSSGSPRRDDRR